MLNEITPLKNDNKHLYDKSIKSELNQPCADLNFCGIKLRSIKNDTVDFSKNKDSYKNIFKKLLKNIGIIFTALVSIVTSLGLIRKQNTNPKNDFDDIEIIDISDDKELEKKYFDENEILNEALERIKSNKEQLQKAKIAQNYYKNTIEGNLSNKSAEQSAQVFIQNYKEKEEIKTNNVEKYKKLKRKQKVEVAPDLRYIDDVNNIEYLKSKIQNYYQNKGYGPEEVEQATDDMLDLIIGDDILSSSESQIFKKIAQSGISEDERFAIGHVDAGKYNQISRMEGDCIEADLLDIIMDNLVPTDKDLILYREIIPNHLTAENKAFIKELKRKGEGEIILDKEFAYSSSDKDIIKILLEEYASPKNNNMLMNIKVPKGAKISYTPYSKQTEYLFPRNAEYRIIKPYDSKTKEVFLEYLHQ